MSSLFEDFITVMEPALDTMFAEEEGFSFQPMVEVVNSEPEVDDSRDALEGIIGIFSDESQPTSVVGVSGSPMDLDSIGPRLSLQTSILSDIRRFDQFTRVKTGIVYEVTEILPDGMSRVLVRLKELP